MIHLCHVHILSMYYIFHRIITFVEATVYLLTLKFTQYVWEFAYAIFIISIAFSFIVSINSLNKFSNSTLLGLTVIIRETISD